MKPIKYLKVPAFASAFLAALMLGTVPAPAQMPGGKTPGGMNAAMIKLFGSNTSFTSKSEVHVIESNQQESMNMPMRFVMSDGKVRADIDMALVKGAEMPPNLLTTLKQMGMDKMVTIMRPDTKEVLIIYPGLKSYAQFPMSKEEAAAADVNYKIEKTKLGKETIDGHPCDKSKVVLSDEKGEKQEATVWNATDLKNFPVQMQMAERGSTLLMKFKDVQLVKPNPAEFEVPVGMTKYTSPQALLQDAIIKQNSQPAPPPSK